MADKLNQAAELVGEALGKAEVATTVVGARTQKGISEAATALGQSEPIDRLEKRLRPARKAIAKAGR